MLRAIRTLSDLAIAVTIGVVTETILALRAFELGSDLVEQHPWLEISQMLGAQISERIFHQVGVPQALIFALLGQGVLFSVAILGVIYAYRLIRARLEPR